MNNDQLAEYTYPNINDCPCQNTDNHGKPLTYKNCCQPFHQHQNAPSAEQLMRSRYSAFVLKLYDYLIATHHPDYVNGLTQADLADAMPLWLGLEIENVEAHIAKESLPKPLLTISQQFNDNPQATVTFKAWYKADGGVDAIYERSHFVKEGKSWFYTSGMQYKVKPPKRNDLCVCKSGKKAKQCCLR